MPNWCENSLSISGKDEDMQKLFSIIKTDESDSGLGDTYQLLDKLYPTPNDLLIGDVPIGNTNDQQKENFKKYGYTDWYDWRIAKWGTKWTESDLFVSQEYRILREIGTIAFQFETAWSPPIEAFDKISADYPNLLFCLYYEEPGMGFCGKDVWANGESVEKYESELIQNYFDEEYLFKTYITK